MEDFIDILSEGVNFFINVFVGIYFFIIENKILFVFFLIPIATVVFYIVIDSIFDIRDMFTDFNRLNDDGVKGGKYIIKSFRNKKSIKQKRVDINDYYQKQRDLADYKHKFKMQEMHEFQRNENIRHQHKVEESNLYKSNMSNPKVNSKKKVNLDIEVED